MNLKSVVAILAVATMPVCAQAQTPSTAQATKLDAERVVKIISADKAKSQVYCDLVKLGDQIEQADQIKDSKKVDELSNKMDALSEKLGPEYLTLMDGVQDLDPNSKQGQDIGNTLGELDKFCGN